MRRLELIYLAIFVLSVLLLGLFILRDHAVRQLNQQLQTLHYARQDFDAGALHILLADTSLVQWQREVGQQRFAQALASLLEIASEHVNSRSSLQQEILQIKQSMELLLSLSTAPEAELSQQIIRLRLNIEQLYTLLNAELQRELKNSRYWFLSLVFSAILLVAGLFITLLRTERKRARFHKELYDSEHRLSLIADNIDEVFWLKNAETGELLYLSSTFEKLWQLPVRDIHANPDIWLQRVHPDDRQSVHEAIAQSRLQSVSVDFRIVQPDDEIKWVCDRLFPVSTFNDNNEVIQLIIVIESDITQAKLLNEKLSIAQKLESLGKLTGGIAHDFNNLLTVIMGNAQLINDLLLPDSPLSEIAALIVKAAERGASLNRQLLAFASKQQLKPEKIDVCELLSDMQHLLRRTMGDSIRIDYQPCPNDVYCFVDAGQLQNALINLCINAKDAMPAGGTISISLQRSDDNNYAVIHVADTGEGIADSVLPHIFEPFFTTKAKQKGSGLGLSMVYGFVKQSGGNIKVKSLKSQGSCFTLLLPLCTDSENAGSIENVLEQPLKAGKKLLLVEDDDMVRDSVLQMLGNTDYSVVSAANADSGLALLNEHLDFDIMLTDIIMPGQLNGIALADYVQQHFPEIAIILTSGYVGDLQQQYSSFASYAFLAKPFSKTQLLTALAQLETH
ncbi:His Kinase A (phospho-acceptor) domain-containing protein [Arsukibacterium tuosuense]|uniref:histidine kinase n=2 Tax=Arsukibacterium tuosuense TaxID=1323745 RepID=A0A285IG26_9GAMM|nr:His Kinase A (phospho-acceptor) domain-containing protein [Arsukibacterium tuosuense]